MKKRSILVLMVIGLVMLLCLPVSGESLDQEPVMVSLSESELLISAGQNKQLKLLYAKAIRWKKNKVLWQSSNEETATVNQKGVVKGKQPGETEITCTVTMSDGTEYVARSRVTVIIPVSQLEQDYTTILIKPGQSKRISVTIQPEDATIRAIAWSSQNDEIVTIDEEGCATANKAGKTRITALTTDGTKRTAYWDVIVPTVYSEKNIYTIDHSEAIQIPVFFEGEDFSTRYTVETTGCEISYETLITENKVVFTIAPLVAGEAHIMIKDRKNTYSYADIEIDITNDALPSSDRLKITLAEIISGTQVLTYRFDLFNSSAEEIGEIGFLVDYRDQFGDTHYLISNTDGSIQNHQYTTMINILPGESGTVYGQNEVFRANNLIKEVRLAVNYYRYLSGQKVYIPDSQLYWFSTKTGELDKPTIKGIYVQPDEETMDRALRINMGATQCSLYSYVVKEFSRSRRPGVYLASMNENGYAAKWGLQVGDVIYGVDEILWEDDPFVLNRALCDVYDGKTVTLKVVRNGEEIEIRIAKDI